MSTEIVEAIRDAATLFVIVQGTQTMLLAGILSAVLVRGARGA